MSNTAYADERTYGRENDITFINNKGVRLVKSFESEYQARMFVNKLKHSKKCVLVSYPNFK